MLQLLAIVGGQTSDAVDAIGFASKLIPEGVSVAAVIVVVVLFLRRQAESQKDYQAQLDRIAGQGLERDKMFVSSMDRLAEKIDRIGSGSRRAVGG